MYVDVHWEENKEKQGTKNKVLFCADGLALPGANYISFIIVPHVHWKTEEKKQG